MKRVVCFLLALFIYLVFTACGTQAPANTENLPPATQTPQQKAQPTAEPGGEPTIESAVIYDEGGVKVTAKSLNLNGILGPELNLLIENGTDKNLTIQARNVSVNDYMISTIFSVDVPAGKKANDAIVLEEWSLEDSGVEKIADIELYLNIFETDSWDDYAKSGKIAIQSSIAGSHSQQVDRSGKTVLDEGGIKVICKGIDHDGFLGPEIKFLIENGSDKDITVQAGSVSVNGFAIDPIFSSDVLSGKRIVDSMTIMQSDIEENEIESVTEVEFSLIIFDADTFEDIIKSEPVTLEFE